MEYALVSGLAVIIVGTVVLSVVAFLDDETPTGETTGKQQFHCLECEHEFDALDAYPELQDRLPPVVQEETLTRTDALTAQGAGD